MRHLFPEIKKNFGFSCMRMQTKNGKWIMTSFGK